MTTRNDSCPPPPRPPQKMQSHTKVAQNNVNAFLSVLCWAHGCLLHLSGIIACKILRTFYFCEQRKNSTHFLFVYVLFFCSFIHVNFVMSRCDKYKIYNIAFMMMIIVIIIILSLVLCACVFFSAQNETNNLSLCVDILLHSDLMNAHAKQR